MPKPNFFIVGAPKSGTTSLYNYLRQHPSVFMPKLKEPFYFGRDLEFRIPYWFIRDEARYLELFDEVGDAARIGEGTVWYLRSRQAATEIREYSPDAKIIIMLRNPVEMMYSWHSQMLWADFEDIEDFATALAAEAERKAGRRIPARACVAEGLLYREMAGYTEQVQRYLDVFGPERTRVIIFDDFKQDVAAAYRQTLRFLEVDEEFVADFPIVNENTRARSKTLIRLLRTPPPGVVRFGRALLPERWRARLFQTLWAFNRQMKPRPTLQPELRRQLQAEFQPEVERLSELLKRDLSHWCRV